MKKQSTRKRIDAASSSPPAPKATAWRDRIKELRRVPAAELLPHPLNWRIHPPQQRAVLEALLREIGFANALLARELPDGSLQIIDGHLRAETTPEMEVPVLVLDVDEREAEKLLATLDPLGAMAAADAQAVAALQERIAAEEQDLANFLDSVRTEAEKHANTIPSQTSTAEHNAPLALPNLYQVMIECDEESAQQTLYDELTARGFRCRALVL